MDGKKNKISTFSVLMAFIVLFVAGAGLIPFLNVQFLPSESLPVVSVNYSWPNASAQVVEQEVTSKLEAIFSTIDGIQDISSVSNKSGGRITISLKKQINLDAARFEIATVIRQVYPKLPQSVSYPSISLGSSGKNETPILTYSLNANENSYYIQKYAEENIKSALSLVKGVSRVSVMGATPYEWEIRFNSQECEQLGIAGADISQSINSYFDKEVLGTGLYRNDNGRERSIRVFLQNKTEDHLNWSKVPIKKVGGRMVYLTDIAKVVYKEQQPDAYFRINGKNTVDIIIYPEPGENTIRLAAQVKKTVGTCIKKLPNGYSMILANDQTEYLNKELTKIGYRILFSLLILLSFVFLVSRNWRYLLLIFISIVSNLVIACIFYYFFKLEIHLYTLAGITVSFGMIIDNSIIMIDHLQHHHNRGVFVSILATTMTTIGALSIIFFLPESQRLNLSDFVRVIIINLSVSMIVASLFIPALFEKIPLPVRRGMNWIRKKRRIARFSMRYAHFIDWNQRHRWLLILLLIFGFGLPVYKIPDHIEEEKTTWDKVFNATLGSDFYQSVRGVTDKILGGSLRLFAENIFSNSYDADPQRIAIYVAASMPEGTTVQQMNEVMKQMEQYIGQFKEVDIFQTSILGPNSGQIVINFKPQYEKSGAPLIVESNLESMANSLGGADWSISGVGQGFHNGLNSDFKTGMIELNGYNYEQLYYYAEILKNQMLANPRVPKDELEISGQMGGGRTLHEYALNFNPEGFARDSLSLLSFYGLLNDKLFSTPLESVMNHNELQSVSLVSDEYGRFSAWDLKHQPFFIGQRFHKLSTLGNVEKEKLGDEICKTNQQYQLFVNYNFIGAPKLAEDFQKENIDAINKVMPLGFKAKTNEIEGMGEMPANKSYLLILLVIGIIYFVCTILLESFRQPFAIILAIPVAYIGVFLTFYLFELNFDQGGFASFILLSGIVVNAGLYIINQYNRLCRERNESGSIRLYLKAWNDKIIPICLTTLSTVLGLVPFLWNGQKEVFWFAFAVGSIGGLFFSLIAVFFYLPLFLKFKHPDSKK